MILTAALLIAAYSKPVTAICEYGNRLYVGTSTGEVERLNLDQAVEQTISGAKGQPVAFVAASPYGIAWLSGKASSIREKQAAATPAPLKLYIKSADGSKTITAELNPAIPVRRLSWIGGKVAVGYDLSSTFFDTRGRELKAADFFPKEGSGLEKSSLYVHELADGTELAVFARPYSVRRNPQNQDEPLVSLLTAFQVGGQQWINVGGIATTAFDAFPDGELMADEHGRVSDTAKYLVLSDRIALAEDGIVAREAGSLVSAPVMSQNWEISRKPIANSFGDALWFGANEKEAWSWNGTALIQQSRATGQVAVFIPWAKPTSPTSFAVSDNGIWIGTPEGLRFIHSAATDDKNGFNKITFGGDATESIDPNAKALTAAVFAWRFADQEKAGVDGAKMIASIFSTAGLQLPQTAPELMQSGQPVTGELKFGDVLLTETASAFYLGNGITVQLRNGKVGNGDIWAWPKATVRRFLP